MSWVRLAIYGSAGVLLALAVWLVVDRFEQKAQADRAVRCERAAADPAASLDDCTTAIAARVVGDRMAYSCDEALLPSLTEQSRFAAFQTCRSGTKRLIAERDAAQAEIANLHALMAEAGGRIGAAIDRAEARATKSQNRKDTTRDVIQTAPRDADSNIQCDADCLRRLLR